jgi:hypothetical protein
MATTIDNYAHELLDLHNNDYYTNDQLLDWLSQHGVTTSKKTLRRRLEAWGAAPAQALINVGTDAAYNTLVALVGQLYHHNVSYSDSQIAEVLQSEYNQPTSTRQVMEIRRREGWWRRLDVFEDRAFRQLQTTEQVQLLLEEGSVRQYGRRQLITRLCRERGFRGQGRDVRWALHTLDSHGVFLRTRGFTRNRRENFTTDGPDYMWCLDGHDKLARWGIEIYGCVDAYSRKIIWFYVGHSNRTSLSVFCQYLQAIRSRGLCPAILRSDHGTETPMMADAHYYFYWFHHYFCGATDEELESLHFLDSYIYGPSTGNIRIEGSWNLMIMSVTNAWMDLFRFLTVQGLFRDDLPTDKVIFIYIFLPLLQSEIWRWVEDHNSHSIRRDRYRSQHVPGVPNDLYVGRPGRGGRSAVPNCGFTFDSDLWESFWEETTDYGTYL